MLDRRTFFNYAPALVVIFIDKTARMIAFPILIHLMSSTSSFLPSSTPLKLRLVYLSLALMANPLFKFLGTNYLGSLSDIIKRKKTLILTAGGLSVALLLSGVSIIVRSVPFIICMSALTGFVSGSKSIAFAAIVDSTPKEERTRGFAIANFVYSFGIVLGPLIGGFFSDRQISPIFTPELPFFIGSLLSALSIIWIIFGFKETFGKKHRRRWSFSELYAPFARSFQHKKMRLLIPHTFFLGFGLNFLILIIWERLSQTLHVSTLSLGLFIGCSGLVSILASLFIVSPLTKRLCTEKLLTWVIVVTLAVVAIQAYFFSFIALWILLVPREILIMIVMTCIYTNASHASGKHHQGWAMGAVSGSYSIAWTIASLSLVSLAGLGFTLSCWVSFASLCISWLFLVWHRGIFHPAKLEEEIETMDS